MHQQDMQLTDHIPAYIYSLSPYSSYTLSLSSSKLRTMERERSKQQLLLLLAAFLCHSLVIHVMSEVQFEDQKNFFYADPNANTPPTVYDTPPPYGGHSNPTPTHGGAPPTSYGTPPSHNPSPPTPTGHGGGYYSSPPSSDSPVILTPPSNPSITVPSPPLAYDPNSPPYTCTYWKNHPTLIWGLFGWWGNVGNAFGVTSTSLPGDGANMNLVQALSNTRTDGYGELYREGTAALLNSMAETKFPYTSTQVKDRFSGALGSNKAAAAQARVFKLANEGKIKARV